MKAKISIALPLPFKHAHCGFFLWTVVSLYSLFCIDTQAQMEASEPLDLAPLVHDDLNLMPYPSSVKISNGVFPLTQKASAVLVIQSTTINTAAAKRMTTAISRSLNRLNLTRFTPQKIQTTYANGATSDNNLNAHNIIFIVESANTTHQAQHSSTHPQTFLDESYSLQITDTTITVNSVSEFGLHRALATLEQLGKPDANKTLFPQLLIRDRPRFVWRGLLIDSARHFFSVDTMKRQIDGMAAAKLNVLHWHLTDDQGWRYESKKFPELTALGADGQFYSQHDMREIVDYAASYGIHVLPEIDMPGHTSALALAFPELMSKQRTYTQEVRWGVHTPLLDPTKKSVYQFIDALITEVSEVFPFPFIHIGGDEVNPEDWLSSEHITTYMHQNNINSPRELQLHFNSQVNRILKKHGKNLIGWDEILTEGLDSNAIIQSWRGKDSLFHAVTAGYQAILSTGYYLDQPQPTAYHYRNDPATDHPIPNSQVKPATQQKHYTFSIPRKRGSNVQGHLAMHKFTNGNTTVTLKFNGRQQRHTPQVSDVFDELWFEIDTWMGPTRFQLAPEQTRITGRVKVGNSFYTVSGELIDEEDFPALRPLKSLHPLKSLPSLKSMPPTSNVEKGKILGGEIALWSELIDEESIDSRLWPRAFAVAERLWSPANIDDEKSMHSRLHRVSQWSAHTLNLKHQEQLQQRIAKLANYQRKMQNHIRVLTETLEPAQYYHRHHEKSVYATYSRLDPLNKLADVLPAENTLIRNTRLEMAEHLNNNDIFHAAGILQTEAKRWKKNAQYILSKRHKSTLGQDIRPIARANLDFSIFILNATKRIKKPSQFTKDEIIALYKALEDHQQITEETVISASVLLEDLLIKLWEINAAHQY
ncbi:Beta-hexosaminidase [Thalassocella blandensis]|nr:Beta-hexosaminidase [Thalassocella blandensis]